MAETYGFYDTEKLVDGTYDREYIAQQWADYFKLFIGTGVFASPTNQLKVVAGEGMNIIVKEGWAFIEGRWYHNDADLIIPVQPNTTASTITSGVFIRADSSNREIKAIIATGRTTPDREAPYYELELAQIQLATGTTAITNSLITDMRPDESVCGFVKGLLEGVIPTADLFIQFEAQFNTWFQKVKDQLSEDAAGHLQNEIDEISNQLKANDGLKFQFAENNGEHGYLDAQGTFHPFKHPVGVRRITTNGLFDVTDYARVDVNVDLSNVEYYRVYSKGSQTYNCTVNYYDVYDKTIKPQSSIHTIGGEDDYIKCAGKGEGWSEGDGSTDLTFKIDVDVANNRAFTGANYYKAGSGFRTFTYQGSNTYYVRPHQNSSAPLTRGVLHLGRYSTNTTIDVTGLGATSVNQFLVTTASGSASAFSGAGGSNISSSSGYTPATLSLSGNTLTVTAPTVSVYHHASGGAGGPSYGACTYDVYFVGDIGEKQ